MKWALCFIFVYCSGIKQSLNLNIFVFKSEILRVKYVSNCSRQSLWDSSDSYLNFQNRQPLPLYTEMRGFGLNYHFSVTFQVFDRKCIQEQIIRKYVLFPPLWTICRTSPLSTTAGFYLIFQVFVFRTDINTVMFRWVSTSLDGLKHTDPFTSLRLHFCELNQEHISSLQICSFGLLSLVQPNFGFKTLIMCVRCVASTCVRFIPVRISDQVFWIPQAIMWWRVWTEGWMLIKSSLHESVSQQPLSSLVLAREVHLKFVFAPITPSRVACWEPFHRNG